MASKGIELESDAPLKMQRLRETQLQYLEKQELWVCETEKGRGGEEIIS